MLRLMMISLMVILWGCHHNIQADHSTINADAQSLMADFAHQY